MGLGEAGMTLTGPTKSVTGALCGVVTKGRPPCRNTAGKGTTHLGFGPCEYHGGRLPRVADKQARAMVAFNARAELAQLGQSVEVNPEQALLDLVSQSAALVTFYGEEVSRLAAAKPAEGANPHAVSIFSAGYEQGSGLFGPKIDLDKDGGRHVVGEEQRGMVVLWNEERDRLAKYSSAALKAGIEKRRVEMAEHYGNQIVVVINNVLVKIGLNPDQIAEARTLMAGEFRQIAQEGA